MGIIPHPGDKGGFELGVEEFPGNGAAVPGGTAAPPSPDRPIRILLVENHRVLRSILHQSLARAGFAVDVCQDGAQALECLQTRSYSLLITDFSMPRMNGLDLLRRLREAGSLLPAILITGNPPEDVGRVRADLRLEAILEKPFSMETLTALAERTLGGISSTRTI